MLRTIAVLWEIYGQNTTRAGLDFVFILLGMPGQGRKQTGLGVHRPVVL